ncbi:hypothetical protein [Mesorhizobium sp.]|uniref:hypothetical protein n=1 Tax=Mesorhizobium sp. TaxID=1871066 RepID=UPI000FE6F79F|nr:hypothetical protein [Mesorhizobium sp.]RWE37421.1 MAG: hypothetical protein EOS77_02255 [Mesorhizobium sp.]
MHLEDGDELPIRATFMEVPGGKDYGRHYLATLPSVGHTVVIGSARKGLTHVVQDVIHHIGGTNHSIKVIVRRA